MAIRTLIIDPAAFGSGEEVRDALLALPDEERAIIVTRPEPDDFRVVQIDGTPRGKKDKVNIKVSYDDVPSAAPKAEEE